MDPNDPNNPDSPNKRFKIKIIKDKFDMNPKVREIYIFRYKY
jgi:hypothetical protein